VREQTVETHNVEKHVCTEACTESCSEEAHEGCYLLSGRWVFSTVVV